MPTIPCESALLFFVAYAIGFVLLMTAGIYDGPLAEPSILVIAVSLSIVVFMFVRMLAKRPLSSVASRPVLVALGVGLVVYSFATFADARLLIDADRTPALNRALALAQVLLLATYGPALLRHKPEPVLWTDLRFTLFAAIWCAGSVSVLHASRAPHIDVWHLQTEGALALLRGENPYQVVQIVETSPVRFLPSIGFVYPPAPCFLSALAYGLGGDVRWGMLTGWLVSGIAMRLIARRGVLPFMRSAPGSASSGEPPVPALAEDAPALLLWLSPKAFFIVEQSWNDAYPLAFFSLAVLAHLYGRSFATAVLLGLAVSTKQSMIWFVPLAFLLGFDLRRWAVFLGSAAATIAPFAIWDFHALKHWTVDAFVGLPPRADALTLMNWFNRHLGIRQSGLPGVLLAAAISAFAVVRAPRTRYAFTLSAALACFSFYLFNVQMFINYYYFVTGLGGVAAAVAVGTRRVSSST